MLSFYATEIVGEISTLTGLSNCASAANLNFISFVGASIGGGCSSSLEVGVEDEPDEEPDPEPELDPDPELGASELDLDEGTVELSLMKPARST